MRSVEIWRAVSLTLVFSISTLYLLMYPLLHLALENTGPGRFVEVGDFQDVCRIDPVVGSAAHYVVSSDIEFVYGHLRSDISLDGVGRRGVEEYIRLWAAGDGCAGRASGKWTRGRTYIAICGRINPCTRI